MPATRVSLGFFALCAQAAVAQIAPEQAGVEVMASPGANWFISKTQNGAYIFDADTGDMQGLLSLSAYTASFEVDRVREQFYAPESYYSRGVHGERTDVVTVYDFAGLSPVAEIEIPKKIAALPFRRHVGMLDDNRHFLVYNLTPAQSVTVVDVERRSFVGEISTPGCAMIMPVAGKGFLMICGDGTLQLLRLDDEGRETRRDRSKRFFKVLEDPVFDRPVPTPTGWLLLSHAGLAFDVAVQDADIRIGEAWTLAGSEDEEGWRPGGIEFASLHAPTGLLYVLMHEADREFTHHDPGTEIWVFDARARRLLERLELPVPAFALHVTQGPAPRLVVGDENGALHIYNALTFRLDRTLSEPGPPGAYYMGF